MVLALALLLPSPARAGACEDARALAAADLPLAASARYRAALEDGAPCAADALAALVTLARALDDEPALLPLVDLLKPEDIPSDLRPTFAWIRGLSAYEAGEFGDALAALAEVPAGSDYRPKALFLSGVIYGQQGKLKSAVFSYRDVYRSEGASDDLRDLAVLNIARIYYSIERYDEAEKYYSLIRREGPYFPVALQERAWARFMKSDRESAAGDLVSLRSPAVTPFHFQPEAPLLDALIAFNLCDYEDTFWSLDRFEAEYEPICAELTGLGRSTAPPEDTWRRYFAGGPDTPSSLPRSFFAESLRDQDLGGAARRLAAVQAEIARVPASEAEILAILAQESLALERRAGLELRALAARRGEQVCGLLVQAEVIRFEIAEVHRLALEPRPPELESWDPSIGWWGGYAPIRLTTAFNGELWADELGYYSVDLENRCGW